LQFFTVNTTFSFNYRFFFLSIFPCFFFFTTPFTSSNTVNPFYRSTQSNYTDQDAGNKPYPRLATANTRKTHNSMDPTQCDKQPSSGQDELEGTQAETQTDYRSPHDDPRQETSVDNKQPRKPQRRGSGEREMKDRRS